VLDEGSTNGTYVNGGLVPAAGKALADGDKIELGDCTTLWVRLQKARCVQPKSQPNWIVNVHKQNARRRSVMRIASTAFVALLLAGVITYGVTLFLPSASTVSEEPKGMPAPLPSPSAAVEAPKLPPPPVANQTAALPAKLYKDMTPDERMAYVKREATHVSQMVGNRPCEFTDEVMRMIKANVDGYAARVGRGSTKSWAGQDFRAVFERATRYAPLIIRAFNQENIKPAIGLYIAMIEGEYNKHCYDNFAGAMGMFQFIAGTARLYGVAPEDRCDEKKMAPAAARYLRDRITEFGTDATSVGLAIAGYNRNPDHVRRDLYAIIQKSDNPERSFWNLVAHADQLDHWFQENMKYVPKFFAAAIVCENPEMFGLPFNPLSTYTEEKPGRTDAPE
jgi:Transglycosylase SLT domain